MTLKCTVLIVFWLVLAGTSSAQVLFGTYDTPVNDSTSSQEERSIFLSGIKKKDETWHRFKQDSSLVLSSRKITYYYQRKDTFIVSERNMYIKGSSIDTVSFEDVYFNKDFRFIRRISSNPKDGKLSITRDHQIERDELSRITREVTFDASGQISDETVRTFNDKENSVIYTRNLQGGKSYYFRKDYFNPSGFITRSYTSRDGSSNWSDSVIITRDSKNRMVSFVEFGDKGKIERRVCEYDAFGNLTKRVSFAGDKEESVYTYQYDPENRIIRELGLGGARDTLAHMLYTYDSTENLAKKVENRYMRSSPGIIIEGGSGYFKTTYSTTYDDKKRVISSFHRSASISSGRTRKYNELGDVIEEVHYYNDKPVQLLQYSYTYSK